MQLYEQEVLKRPYNNLTASTVSLSFAQWIVHTQYLYIYISQIIIINVQFRNFNRVAREIKKGLRIEYKLTVLTLNFEKIN